jgi:hypothetical protein
MADFAARMPVEEDKATWLHNIDNRPKRTPLVWRALLHRYWGVGLGFLLALGFQALSYETRAGWSSRRDWVEPSLTVFWAAGGMCAGLLFARRAWSAAAPGLIFLSIGLTFTVLNIVRHAYVDGPDALLTALDILAVLSYACMLIAFIGAVIWLEWKRPLKVAPPEM